MKWGITMIDKTLSAKKPSYNVDQLQGAIMHMLAICGTLSIDALADFSIKFAYQRGRRLQREYVINSILGKMERSRKIYRTGTYVYSANPLLTLDHKALNSFWVFLETMDGVDLESVMYPEFPARLSYIRNGKIFNIIPCEGEGFVEFASAVQIEIHMAEHFEHPEEIERFIFVFTSPDYMNRQDFSFKIPTMFACVQYQPDSQIPSITFKKPQAN